MSLSLRLSGLSLSVTFLAAAWLSPEASAAAPRPVTVGDFAVRLARSLGFTVDTPAEAQEKLGGIGVALEGEVQSPLTQAQAIGFVRGLGLTAADNLDPSALLTGPRADLLARVASEAILSTPAPPGLNGSIPASCTRLGQSQCFNCCVASLLGFTAIPQRVISICNSSCTAILSQTGASPSGP
jgi:hypothetical protein